MVIRAYNRLMEWDSRGLTGDITTAFPEYTQAEDYCRNQEVFEDRYRMPWCIVFDIAYDYGDELNPYQVYYCTQIPGYLKLFERKLLIFVRMYSVFGYIS